MKVLLVGSGGREHALAWKIAQSPDLEKLFVAPGNAGMAEIGECVSIKPDDIEALLSFAKEKRIDLTVVGPEAPLAKGIVDRFQSEGMRIFGPNQKAAQLESSKIFAKEIMTESGVPTASFKVFQDASEAKRHIVDHDPPFVIKADGLAGGKGVIVANSCAEGIAAVNAMIAERVFGDAGRRVIIEDCLVGTELSILVLTDGETIIPLASSQDHKRAFDNDKGPNTGGMGAYSPCPFLDEKGLEEIVQKTARPVIQLLKNKSVIYRGVLYVGIMMTAEGPRVLEYNVRFGDPETQAILPRLKTNLLPLLFQIANGQLETKNLTWDPRACLSVVMASAGYPGSYQTGFPIIGLKEVKPMKDVLVFHAGTAFNEQRQICTAGGRVLNVSTLGNTLREACDTAYSALQKIFFKGARYRTDIGKRALLTGASLHEHSEKIK